MLILRFMINYPGKGADAKCYRKESISVFIIDCRPRAMKQARSFSGPLPWPPHPTLFRSSWQSMKCSRESLDILKRIPMPSSLFQVLRVGA